MNIKTHTNCRLNFFFFSLLLLCYLLPGTAFSQNTVTISGKVTEEKTGKPLPFANVFINNSSIGTSTDEQGNYKLGNLPVGSLELVVSFLGFETIKQTLRFETAGPRTVLFKMREGMELKGVTVYAKKNKKREQYLKILTRELLGTNAFSKLCKITNTEVIRISKDDNGHITAQSNSPVIIENQALGYRIFQDLDDFDFFNGVLHYIGSTRFELLKPKDETQKKLWRTNQEKVYRGSLKHLLASMVADSVQEEGFRIYQEIPDSLRIPSAFAAYGGPLMSNHIRRTRQVRGRSLIRAGELETERLVVSPTLLEIFNTNKRERSPYNDLPYAYSRITMPQGFIVITPEGWVSMPMGNEIAGALGRDRFANLLPADWKKDLSPE